MSELAVERQQERLRYIDLCAYVLGFVNRNLIMSRFDIKQAWATKDIAQYQHLSSERLKYSHKEKGYVPVDWFSPLFEHDCKSAVSLVAKGEQVVDCELKMSTNAHSDKQITIRANLQNVCDLFKSVYRKKKTEIEYISTTSGLVKRLVVPHSIFMSGLDVYVRAYDHYSGSFRTFKLSRVVSSKFTDFDAEDEQLEKDDGDWNTEVTITLTPNPLLEHPESISLDYGLTDGEIAIQVKKAMVMFFLKEWNVAPQRFSELPAELFPLVIKQNS